MTREEAKKIADFVRSCVHEVITESGIDKNAHTNEVLRKMAEYIENMRVNPSEDAISRQAVLDLAEWFRINQQHFTVDNLIDEVENIPSVNPKTNPVHLIDEAKLLKAIDTWDKFGVDDTNSLFRLDNLSLPHYVPYMRYDDVVKCIKGMPSVTPKPRVGHWQNVGDRTDWYDATYKCSCCGREITTPYELRNNLYSDYPYCHCGAKMAESEY